ncbi:polyadenylate-binding 2-like [Brachionus plicatilis]|uniref:Polyadenylate-binding 2-like n=1 Tax=Brachionus plicatilis TaxID=10195 RepID=A0A3M7QND5_BRAPC|nr:polyadenylate-binding 2-like [Brachionus plicatilis]
MIENSYTSLLDPGIEHGHHRDNQDRTVYLGDLDIDTSEPELSLFFERLGVHVNKIAKQPHTSFAHVTFMDSYTAKKFLQSTIIKLNQKIVRVMPFNQPNNFDPEANLIIKNLEGHLNETDIIDKFKQHGKILSCKLVRDEKGESKCYAYLQYESKQSALNAIDSLNNTYWDSRCDPDYRYKKFLEKQNLSKNKGKLFEANFEESQLFNEYNNVMGKKIYVGIFKRKDEYSRIKSDKDGKPSNLYVKNFGPDFGDRDLFNLFKKHGSIKSVKVRRSNNGICDKPLGCGFVDFENPNEAEKARQELDGFMLRSGRRISVTYADCKSRRLRQKNDEKTTPNSVIPKEVILRRSEFSREDFKDRRDSMCSLISDSTVSSVNANADLTNELWSKLLNTPNWNEYKLFDSTSNLSLFAYLI